MLSANQTVLTVTTRSLVIAAEAGEDSARSCGGDSLRDAHLHGAKRDRFDFGEGVRRRVELPRHLGGGVG